MLPLTALRVALKVVVLTIGSMLQTAREPSHPTQPWSPDPRTELPDVVRCFFVVIVAHDSDQTIGVTPDST